MLWLLVIVGILVVLYFAISYHKPNYSDAMYKLIGVKAVNKNETVKIPFNDKDHEIKQKLDTNETVVAVMSVERESFTNAELEFFKKENKALHVPASFSLFGKRIDNAYVIVKKKKYCSYYLEDEGNNLYFYIEDGNRQDSLTSVIERSR